MMGRKRRRAGFRPIRRSEMREMIREELASFFDARSGGDGRQTMPIHRGPSITPFGCLDRSHWILTRTDNSVPPDSKDEKGGAK